MPASTCPLCGQPVRSGVRFCGSCGAALPPAPATCPRCGGVVNPGARFCPACGEPLATQPPGPAPAMGLGWPPPSAPTPWTPAASPPTAPAQTPPAPPWPQDRPAGAWPPAAPVPAWTPPVTSPGGPADVMPPAAPPARAHRDSPSRAYVLRHAVLGAVLTLSLVLALGWVYARDTSQPGGVPTPPALPSPPPITPTPELAYRDPVVAIGYRADGRFGLRTTVGDPDRRDDDNKNLTFAADGETSNTRLYVDGQTPIYGSVEGRFVQAPGLRDSAMTSSWTFQQVEASQKVEIVAGSTTRRLDTLRIEYVLENKDRVAHQVGLRVMIDTLIGGNDGVPFMVPGLSGITDRAVDLAEVPDFIQALEKADLVSPGVIVQLTLQGGEATPPDRVVICGWYDSDMPWDFLAGAGGVGAQLIRWPFIPDSAVGLYYDQARLGPGEKRTVVTYYGLGGISSTETHNATLALTFNGSVAVGDSFWVVAMVVNPENGQTVRLELPDMVELAPGETAEKAVAAGAGYTQVSWLVKGRSMGSGKIRAVLSPGGVTEERPISVQDRITR